MAIPATMKAAVIERFGGPEELTLRDVPVPVPDPGEVLIAIHTAGVGSWDADIRAGWWPDVSPPTFPLILGTDGSGIVADLGPDVDRFQRDEKVYSYSFANPKGGFYAEYVAVDADKVGRIPPVLDLRQAGAVATIGLTALQGIEDVLHVKAGEAVVIIGASGGVGSMAVQFAKGRGARVFAVASGEKGVALAKDLGADHAIDRHRGGDVAAAIHKFARPGADAILACAGGDLLQRAIEALRPSGRIAWPNGVEPEPDLSKRSDVEAHSYDAVPGEREFERLNKAIVAVRLKVPITAEFPLAEAARAHERLTKRPVLGKIVLRIR